MNGKDLIAVLEYAKTFNKVDTKIKKSKKKSSTSDALAIKLGEHYLEELLKKNEKKPEKTIPELLKALDGNVSDFERYLEERNKSKGRTFTFAEGMLIAFFLQIVIGPFVSHYLQVLQVH